MKRILSTAMALLLSLALILPGAALAEGETRIETAQTLVEQLYGGDYQAVFDLSTADVQSALGSADAFAAAMTQIAQIYGAFEGVTGASGQEQGGYFAAQVVCAHVNADVTYSVALDSNGLLEVGS